MLLCREKPWLHQVRGCQLASPSSASVGPVNVAKKAAGGIPVPSRDINHH